MRSQQENFTEADLCSLLLIYCMVTDGSAAFAVALKLEAGVIRLAARRLAISSTA